MGKVLHQLRWICYEFQCLTCISHPNGCRNLSINRICCVSRSFRSFRSFHALGRTAHSVFRFNKMAGFGDDGFARSGWVGRDVDSSTHGLSRGEKARNAIWYWSDAGLIGMKSQDLRKNGVNPEFAGLRRDGTGASQISCKYSHKNLYAAAVCGTLCRECVVSKGRIWIDLISFVTHCRCWSGRSMVP